MSHAYQAIGWNQQKRIYDFALLGLVLLVAAAFGSVIALRHPETTVETFIIRFTSLTAFVLLHVTLGIGPLARLFPAFMPLLYNRRHLGVTVAVLAMAHGVFSVIQFHAFGDVNPVVSVFTAYDKDYLLAFQDFRSISRFPFEVFGFGALLILFLMAATSHDFWLKNLGPSAWKKLHQLVYLAYGLLLAHILLGVVQAACFWSRSICSPRARNSAPISSAKRRRRMAMSRSPRRMSFRRIRARWWWPMVSATRCLSEKAGSSRCRMSAVIRADPSVRGGL